MTGRLHVITLDERLVALRKESVDRNSVVGCHADLYLVALRKESVDRNMTCTIVFNYVVALRKESVDRNRLGICHYRDDVCRSPQGERG